MAKCNLIILCALFFTLLTIVRNGSVEGCAVCAEEPFSKFINASILKIHNDIMKTKKMISLVLTKSVSVKTKLEVPAGCEFPDRIRTAGDLLSLFNAKDGLIGLSAAEKKTAVELLVTHYGSSTAPLPATVTVNLVTALSGSPTLLAADLSGPHVKSALTTVAFDQNGLLGVPASDLLQLFRRLLSMPAHRILYCVTKPVFVAIVGAVTSDHPDVFQGVPVEDVVNLLTVFSMSKSWFRCLPPRFLLSLLDCVATRPVMSRLPPSTLFGFLDGLFEALGDDGGDFLADTAVTAPKLSAIIKPLLTQRMLSVFPAPVFDGLLFVLGSSPTLTATLSASNVKNVLAVLTTAPRILTSLNAIRVGHAIVAIASSNVAANGSISTKTWNGLFDAVFNYRPEVLEYADCHARQEAATRPRENKVPIV